MTRHASRSRMGVAATAIAALLWTSGAGADGASVEELLNQSVVTTASKSAETAAAAPAMSSTLTADDMDRLGIHSLDEAIDFLSVGVVTSNPLGSPDIGARGVVIPGDRGNHFLLLVNGHAVNEPLFGSAAFGRGAGIPFELIDHIEVVIGPGSVLYGSNAMLGVINVITKRAAHFDGTRLVAESEILKSYRGAVGAGYAFDLLGEPSELTVELEYYRQDGPAFDFGPQNLGLDFTNTPYRFSRDGAATGIWGGSAERSYYAEAPSGVARLIWGEWELNAAASVYKRSLPYAAVHEVWSKDFDDPNSSERDRSLWVDLRRGVSVSSLMDVSVRVYGDLHDYTSAINTSTFTSCLYPGVRTCRYTVVGLSRSLGTELQSSFDWLRTAELVTLVGVDLRVLQVAAKSDTQDYDTDDYLESSYGVIDERDVTLGVFAQQTWQPRRWLAFNGGARLDLDRRFDPVPSPRVAASVTPWPRSTLKAIYSQAFRAPSWYETAYSSDVQVGAPDLRPETVRNVEGIFEQRAGSHRIFAGAFGTWWQDLVELRVLTLEELNAAKTRGDISLRSDRASQFRNIASIEEFGFNAGFDGVLDGRLRYGASMTAALARLERDEDPEPLPVAPRAFGNAHVSYDLGGSLPNLGLAAHFLDRRPSVASRRALAEAEYAPALAEIRATVGGPAPLIPDLSYRVSANYVTADRGPYLVGPVERVETETSVIPSELNPIDRFRVTVGLSYVFGKQR